MVPIITAFEFLPGAYTTPVSTPVTRDTSAANIPATFFTTGESPSSIRTSHPAGSKGFTPAFSGSATSPKQTSSNDPCERAKLSPTDTTAINTDNIPATMPLHLYMKTFFL